MSGNLVTLIKTELGYDFINQAEKLIGESKDNTTKALNQAIILLADAFSKALVSDKNQPFNNQDYPEPTLVENFTALMNEGNHVTLINKGTDLLTTLLGKNNLANISRTIAGSNNVKYQSASTLIALITPLIVGIIHQQNKNNVSETNSLLDVLQEQNTNHVQQTTTLKMDKSEDIEKQERFKNETGKKPRYGKLMWLPLLVIIGLSGYFFLDSLLPQDSELDVATIVDKLADESSSSDYINIGNDLSNIINKITDDLILITDAESATSALPKFKRASTELDSLIKRFNQLSDSAKSTTANIAENKITALQPVIDRVSKIPAANAVVMPVLEDIMQKLTIFSV
jgi:hypothetical protein